MKDQFKVLEVLENDLRVKNYRTGEVLTVPKSTATKTKRKSQGALIEEYLTKFPDAEVQEVLNYLNLKNPIYVKKIQKKLGLR